MRSLGQDEPAGARHLEKVFLAPVDDDQAPPALEEFMGIDPGNGLRLQHASMQL
ncbi:MAG TPA: hypothetical protein VKA18_15395 [Alphaproteobacteria bacterium]|nr:hypothetical protein [Alphaproteobacteria bacterium]